ncbi:MAG: hypothetical protein IKZ03_06615, partial [Clostridia bacterium]|nr:hypothetical protein [Clostridia bacterium]
MNNEEKNILPGEEPVEEVVTEVAPEGKKKLSKGVIGGIIGGAVAVVAAVVILLVVLLGGQKTPDSNPTPENTHVNYVEQVKLDMNSSTMKQEVTMKMHIDGDTTHFYVP